MGVGRVAALSDGVLLMDEMAAVEQVRSALPPVMLIVFGALFVLGLVVWLMGRTLAKPACVLSGLGLGGAAGLAAANLFGGQQMTLLGLTVGSAIAGALIAALLFRLWVGVVGAVLLALVVPAGVLVWYGAPSPMTAATQAATAPAEEADGQDAADATVAATMPSDLLGQVTDALHGLYERQAAAAKQWWQGLESRTRQRVYIGSGIGALVGLVLGLIVPYFAAALESAVAGAILMFFPGVSLLRHWLPDYASWLPESPRMTLVWLGLITVLGVVLQWTIAGRGADK